MVGCECVRLDGAVLCCVPVSRRSWQKLPNMLLSCFLRVCKVGPGGKRFKDPPHLLMRSNLGVFGWKIHHFHFRMKKNPPCASWTEKWFLRLAKRSKQVKIVDCHSNDSIKMIFIMIVVMIFIMIFIMIFTMIFIAIIINIARSSPATEVSRRRSVRQWSYVRWPSLDSSFLLKMAQWRHHSLRPPSPSATPQNGHSALPVCQFEI